MPASHVGNTAFTSPSYCGGMATFLLRVRLPDRPGALGAVASRIGAVRGDVVAMEIAERAHDSAVDEFVVELADEDHLRLLLSEIAEVDGAWVDTVRPVAGGLQNRHLQAYATATALVTQRTPHDVLGVLAERARAELEATWSAVLDAADVAVVAASGRPPAAPWLASYVTQTRAARHDAGPGSPAGASDGVTHAATAAVATSAVADVMCIELAAWDLVLVAGRPGWAFGAHERARLAALGGLVDARWTEMSEREARIAHPSRAG